MNRIACLLCCLLGWANMVMAVDVSIRMGPGEYTQPIVRNAVEDVQNLLQIGISGNVSINKGDTPIQLDLRIVPGNGKNEWAEGRDYPYLKVPDGSFRWTTRRHPRTGQLIHRLEASTANGLANGLYALLQEKLGFFFVHPRETVFPCHDTWPLTETLQFSGQPRFDKRGFHLHAMHPTELTEALHDPESPRAFERLQQYVRWLARNQQNYFDYNLLSTVNFEKWLPHATAINNYAHARGILTSIDISLHMVQQHAWQLIHFPPTTFKSYEKQIEEGIAHFHDAHFDIVNMEFSIAEFVGGMEGLRHRLREATLREIEKYPEMRLFGRQHVVREEDEMGGKKKEFTHEDGLDDARGLLIHTVMSYALDDRHAPVYELENFGHIIDELRRSNRERETWFYPESAYWITFDNSIPMLLLPYLDARYRDIMTVDALNIPGHITFSSGWEWGYWSIDWSIARWSWKYEENGEPKRQTAFSCLEDLFGGSVRHLQTAQNLQSKRLIRENLLRYLCPASFSDELPASMTRQFQPQPALRPSVVYDEAPLEWNDSLKLARANCQSYGIELRTQAQRFENASPSDGFAGVLADELSIALRVTALHALHQARWWEAFRKVVYENAEPQEVLGGCREIREQALPYVRQLEQQHYRYPMEELALRHPSHTSYPYGYLYPVHDLHFWKRRERQLEEGVFDNPFFFNIFDPTRIVGLRR